MIKQKVYKFNAYSSSIFFYDAFLKVYVKTEPMNDEADTLSGVGTISES